MAYSTQTQLTNNVQMINQSFTGAALISFASDRIALADKILTADISRYIDFDSVPDNDTTPVINLLSQYKSAEMSLRRISGIKRRHNENDDISEWQQMYNDLVRKIAEGKLTVELSDGTVVSKSTGTFQDTARPDIRPHQGYDEYGEWLNNTDLEEINGVTSTTKYV